MVNPINSKIIATQRPMNSTRRINSIDIELMYRLALNRYEPLGKNAIFRVFRGLLDANRLGNRVFVKIKRHMMN